MTTLPNGYYPAVSPPDPEWVGHAFLTQFMNGTPVETRVPVDHRSTGRVRRIFEN